MAKNEASGNKSAKTGTGVNKDIGRLGFTANTPQMKQKQRDQLADDVAAFLRNGGKITQVPQGQSGIDKSKKGKTQLVLKPVRA